MRSGFNRGALGLEPAFWIPVIGSGNRYAQTLCDRFNGGIFPPVQPNRVSGGRQVTKGFGQINQPGIPAGGSVQSNGVKISSGENGSNQSGQHGFGSHFHERGDPGTEHIFDFFDKINRMNDLFGEQFPGFGGTGRIGAGGGVGIYRDIRVHPIDFFQGACKRFAGITDQIAVKCRGYRKFNGSKSLFPAQASRFLNGLRRAGQYPLLGGVPVGQKDAVDFLNQFFDLRKRSVDRQHAPAFRGTGFSGSRHQGAAQNRQPEKRFPVQASRGVKRRKFAVTVAARGVGGHTKIPEDLKHGQAHGTDGRLGDFRLPEPVFLGVFFFRRAGG